MLTVDLYRLVTTVHCLLDVPPPKIVLNPIILSWIANSNIRVEFVQINCRLDEGDNLLFKIPPALIGFRWKLTMLAQVLICGRQNSLTSGVDEI